MPGPFRTLWTARIVSFVGDSLSLVALMLHVESTAGQAIALSMLLLAGDFVPSLLSPLAGAVSDRFDLKRVMITCELVQAGLVALIAFSLPALPLLLVLVALRAITGQIFLPASRAAVPALVPDADLPRANSLLGFGTNGAEVAGPLLAAALVPFTSIRGVLFVDAASFLLSAVLLSRLGSLPRVPDGETLVGQAKAGLRMLWRVPALRIIALGFCAVVFFNGIDDVALVKLAKDTFVAGDSAVGLLLAAVGIGLFSGYLLLARFSPPMAALLIAGFAISSVGNLLTGLAGAVAFAFAVQTVRGLGIAGMDVASNTLLQRLVPPAMLGRVFGNLYGAIGIAAAGSYIGGGFLLDATSPSTTFLVSGGLGTLATVVVALTLPRAVEYHEELGPLGRS
ncbi:MFS transporter [Lentzea tibetensis]|uniref:MFS transporter n=2 Tax=Lentzea tibetensis TaxID=2591470 RepID=A0A563F377_9PSEU|nr:MFS transporter [Lentzea tibetensis]